ncbi:MAG TPA: tetratricopeptide repeat protein [Rectinemataceae bacterium]|nr:tetratricopeptide repeat protein [Rectinemataceae bacterium]
MPSEAVLRRPPRSDGRASSASGKTGAFWKTRAQSLAGVALRLAGALALVLASLAGLSSCATSPARKALAVEWYGVGNAWLQAGKFAEAGKAYDRALSLDPGLVAASYNAAHALVEAGSYDRALAIAKGLLSGEPKNVRYISLEAWTYWKAGRMAEAAAAYEAAYVLDPWAEDVVYNSSLLLLEAAGSDDVEKAVDRLGLLVKARPDSKADLALYARALLAAGRDEEAIAAWEDLRSMDGADAAGLDSLAALYEKRGDMATALDVYEAATKKDPASATSWFDLARLRLTLAADGPGGLEALGKALASGFKDKVAATALLASPGLSSREAVAKALVAAGLVEAAGTGLPATSPNPPTPGAGSGPDSGTTSEAPGGTQ